MKKILTLTLTALLAVGNLTAQDQSKHEFSLWGTGGLSALNYSTDVGDSKGGLGSSLGIGYSYSLTDQWSIGTGLELSFHNSKTTFDSYSDSYASNDGEYDFDFYTTVSGYEEKQNAAFLNIPVVAQFQTPVSGENKFYASGGIKIGIPVTGKYEISNTTMKNSGYYPIWDVDMYSPEFMGFGTFNRKNLKEDLDLKVAYSLSLEAGMKWKVSETFFIYTGTYFDYGLNDINKHNNKPLVEYNTDDPENFKNNSVVQTKITDKVVPLAVGLKARLAFKL